MKIGEKIKYYRNQRNLTLQQLAEKAEIEKQTLHKYEVGERNPKPDQIIKIAKALDLSSNALLDIEIDSEKDIMSILLKLEDTDSLAFSAETDETNDFVPDSVTVKFNNPKLNQLICNYLSDQKKAASTELTAKSDYTIVSGDQEILIETDKRTQNQLIEKLLKYV